MIEVGYLLVICGLIFNVISILGVGLFTDLMKKAHCFSLSSNVGMILFFCGFGVLTGYYLFSLMCCVLLFMTSPMLSSILGNLLSKKAIVKEVVLRPFDRYEGM
ncbi:MAG: monovalent cation/H(+) antiporter subunit G [Deltaproteobacteria bacterium]|nr:monovalent cation/H(+) antiporter subunit G [Deltaproteobacteria bacterium]